MERISGRARRAGGRQDGTAVLELAILLPIYVMLAFGILYLGYTALVVQETSEMGYYAVMAPDSQTGEVDGHFFDTGYEGTHSLSDETDKSDVFTGENPTSGNDEFDIHDLLTELSYTFWGGFVLSGGKLEYEVDGGLNWKGKRIEKWNMMDDVDHTAWMLNGYVWRQNTGATYDYTPYFLDAVNTENLLTKEVDEDTEWTELEIETKNSAMARGDRERPFSENLQGEVIYELTDRFPEGQGNRLPGYPDFEGSAPHWERK
jgi:hypothetical protein